MEPQTLYLNIKFQESLSINLYIDIHVFFSFHIHIKNEEQ